MEGYVLQKFGEFPWAGGWMTGLLQGSFQRAEISTPQLPKL